MFVILGLSLLGGLYSVALDLDHIWVWVLGVEPPFTVQGALNDGGRFLHVWYIFLAYALVNAAWITALVRRHTKPYLDLEVIE
jgi:hypothetical protein